MNLTKTIHSQFHKPTGVLGALAGAIMAHRPSNRRRNEWIVELLDVRSTDHVLEIGFGPGYAIELLAERCREGRVVGLDHSKSMLHQASQRNRVAIENCRVSLQLGSVESMQPQPEPFTRVMTVNSYHFWEERVETLRRVRAMMEPGCVIAIGEQPRSRGATDATARKTGVLLRRELGLAGFSKIRIEELPMEPVMVVCALGVA